jgi:DNA-binding IscR family transcriptional regulator
MKLTSATSYAVTALSHLAREKPVVPLVAGTIARAKIG